MRKKPLAAAFLIVAVLLFWPAAKRCLLPSANTSTSRPNKSLLVLPPNDPTSPALGSPSPIAKGADQQSETQETKVAYGANQPTPPPRHKTPNSATHSKDAASESAPTLSPFETWDNDEVNEAPHCAPLMRETPLLNLRPGTIFEIERRVQAGALGNDFVASNGELGGYAGVFLVDRWAKWLADPTNNPRQVKVYSDERYTNCRVVPRGEKPEPRDLRPGRKLILTRIQQPVKIDGTPLPYTEGLVFTFDRDEGIQTIGCKPPPNEDARTLTVGDFIQAFGDRFEICASRKN